MMLRLSLSRSAREGLVVPRPVVPGCAALRPSRALARPKSRIMVLVKGVITGSGPSWASHLTVLLSLSG